MEHWAEELQGLHTETRHMSYTWRDSALYALAVGADGEEPEYVYEKDMRAIPTFGVLPYWGTVGVTPVLDKPSSVPVRMEERLKPEQSYVNLEYEFLYHHPIDPMGGVFRFRDELDGLYDRGEGRGMAVRSKVDVFDGEGRLLCTNLCTTLFPTLGGFGGGPMPRRESEIPHRDPDGTASGLVGPAQNLLYRLTGDTNLVHVDRAVAQARGLDGPFVHDLCAFGYACRMAIGQLFPGEPERLKRMAASMKTVLYPGTPVQLLLWRLGEGRAAWRLVNQNTGKAILDRGVVEWRV